MSKEKKKSNYLQKNIYLCIFFKLVALFTKSQKFKFSPSALHQSVCTQINHSQVCIKSEARSALTRETLLRLTVSFNN